MTKHMTSTWQNMTKNMTSQHDKTLPAVWAHLPISGSINYCNKDGTTRFFKLRCHMPATGRSVGQNSPYSRYPMCSAISTTRNLPAAVIPPQSSICEWASWCASNVLVLSNTHPKTASQNYYQSSGLLPEPHMTIGNRSSLDWTNPLSEGLVKFATLPTWSPFCRAGKANMCRSWGGFGSVTI